MTGTPGEVRCEDHVSPFQRFGGGAALGMGLLMAFFVLVPAGPKPPVPLPIGLVVAGGFVVFGAWATFGTRAAVLGAGTVRLEWSLFGLRYSRRLPRPPQERLLVAKKEGARGMIWFDVVMAGEGRTVRLFRSPDRERAEAEAARVAAATGLPWSCS